MLSFQMSKDDGFGKTIDERSRVWRLGKQAERRGSSWCNRSVYGSKETERRRWGIVRVGVAVVVGIVFGN